MNTDEHRLTKVMVGTITVLLLMTGQASAQPCGGYEVKAVIQVDECPPFGFPPTSAWGLNEQGWVVGSFRACVIGPDVAWLWTPELGLQVIPTPQGTTYSRAVAISGSRIVGEFDDPNELGRTGFLYDLETDQFTSLGTLPDGDSSEAHALNSKGEIVGFWGNTIMGPSPLAFIWRDGEMIDINPDFGTPKSEANDINDNGLVTGWMGTSILTDASAFVWENDKVAPLPPIPGGFTSVGEVVGCANLVAGWGLRMEGKPLETVTRAFLWEEGEMIDLGTLPNHLRSAALSLRNTPLEIVGISWNVDGNPNIRHAFIWADGNMIDLNDLILPDLALNITVATDINGAGQIACTAFDQFNDNVAVLLTPITGPPGDINGDCTVGASDLLLLLSSWGACADCGDCPADIDGNCVVGGVDLLILLVNWG